MREFECRICYNKIGNLSYIAKEMMLGLREQFLYFQCSQCGCLQIAKVPTDMQGYYPSDKYYSFKKSLSKSLIKSKIGLLARKRILSSYFKNFNKISSLSLKALLQQKEYRWITKLKGLNFSSDILDVGAGIGLLLLDLNKLGFKNLTGIDPFIGQNIHHSCGVSILKKNISDLNQKYDLVMLNHVFEHMDSPDEVFRQLYKLLKPTGWLLIRIPIVDCFSWRKYGVSWFQLDAPRHFFLHTVRSMSILAKSCGLDMCSVEYDSNESQFYQSEKYIRDFSLSEPVPFSPSLLKNWKKYSKWLNSVNDGDQACFIFSKTTTCD